MTEESPSVVRVTRTDSVEVVLWQPQVSQDSLIGVVRDPNPVPRRVALGDISSVAVKRTDPLRTVGLVAGIVVGAMALMIGLAGLGCVTNSNDSLVC